MECFGIGCLVEIEITTENFIGSFTAQHHLDTHTFDHAGQEIHRSGGAYGRYVVRLDIIDYVADGIEPFLYRIVDFVVDGADIVGYLPGCGQVGGTFQADSERVELRPPGIGFVIGFDTFGSVFPGNG